MSYTSCDVDPITGTPPVGVFVWENSKMTREISEVTTVFCLGMKSSMPSTIARKSPVV
jgi:hypothetical protein